MCFLANWLATSRAGITNSTVLSFGCAKPAPSLGHENGVVRGWRRFIQNWNNLTIKNQRSPRWFCRFSLLFLPYDPPHICSTQWRIGWTKFRFAVPIGRDARKIHLETEPSADYLVHMLFYQSGTSFFSFILMNKYHLNSYFHSNRKFNRSYFITIIQ